MRVLSQASGMMKGLASGPFCCLSPPPREGGRGRPTFAVTTFNVSCPCSGALGEGCWE